MKLAPERRKRAERYRPFITPCYHCEILTLRSMMITIQPIAISPTHPIMATVPLCKRCVQTLVDEAKNAVRT